MGSNEWVSTTLGELVDTFGGSVQTGPFGSQLHAADYVSEGIPSVMPKNIRIEEIDVEDIARISLSDAERLKKYQLAEGDIVYSRRGDVEKCALVTKNEANWLCGTGCLRIRIPKNKSITPYFLHAFLSTPVTREWVSRHAIGATMPNLNTSILRDVPVVVPPFDSMNFIGAMWIKLNRKIILNRKINQTLEQMSQTLFKSWFVDFDPVIDNALDAGNPIPEVLQSRAELRQKARNSADFKPLPADIRALFPSEFEEMELGLIPKGWKFSNVDSLLKNTIGGDWGSDSEDEKHTTQAMIVRGTDIPELISGKLSSAPYRWVEPKKLEKRRINVGDIIIEVSGGSPTQSTGRSIFMTEQIIDRLGGVVEPASFCRKFEPLSVELGLIISLHLSKIYNDGKMWEYQNQSTGIANFQTKYFLEAEQIVISSTQVINAFYRIVMPWIDKSHNNEQIILGNLRDTLLPKLISGELSLEDLPDLANQTEPA